jgi:hypothetical protein
MKKLVVALTVCGLVASCGGGSGSLGGGSGSANSSAGSSGSGSSAGSFGLFKRKKNEPVTVAQKKIQDFGSLIPQVTNVRVEQVKSGAIIYAKGKASRLGYYDVKLLAPNGMTPDEKGVLTLEFRAKQPEFWTTASTERAREIEVGRYISRYKLDRLRKITVIGAQNIVTVGR